MGFTKLAEIGGVGNVARPLPLFVEPPLDTETKLYSELQFSINNYCNSFLNRPYHGF